LIDILDTRDTTVSPDIIYVKDICDVLLSVWINDKSRECARYIRGCARETVRNIKYLC